MHVHLQKYTPTTVELTITLTKPLVLIHEQGIFKLLGPRRKGKGQVQMAQYALWHTVG